MDLNDKYLVLLRRELTQAQARLKRAEMERDRLQRENDRLKTRSGGRLGSRAAVRVAQPKTSR
jgi:hypothetical protein